MSAQVTGIAKFCDSYGLPCTVAREKATWLKPVVKLMYYCICGKPALRFNIRPTRR